MAVLAMQASQLRGGGLGHIGAYGGVGSVIKLELNIQYRKRKWTALGCSDGFFVVAKRCTMLERSDFGQTLSSGWA